MLEEGCLKLYVCDHINTWNSCRKCELGEEELVKENTTSSFIFVNYCYVVIRTGMAIWVSVQAIIMHSLKDVTHSKKKKSQCYILPLAAIQADGHASSKLHEFFHMSQKQKIIFSFFFIVRFISVSVESRTCEQKVGNSNSGRSGRRIFFSRVNFCVLTPVQCPFHPCVTAVGLKRPRSFFQKCSWQVTPKHAYTLDPLKLEWADLLFRQAHAQLVRERSATVTSARWATVDRSWPKEWN